MGSVFRFKQFEVDQRDCAMKINTDGVLLAATVSIFDAQHILDIGTGTGVIALMLAQRAESAVVDAVEIDESAFNRAKVNFENSPFQSRLQLFKGSYENISGENLYDLIVSNPPFYTNSLHNPDDRKKLARHTDHDFFDKLVAFSSKTLTANGRLSLIVPDDLAQYIVEIAKTFGFSLQEEILLRSFEHSEVIRKIITLKKGEGVESKTSDFLIYREKGVYSDAYRQILKPFFLAF